MSNQCVADPRGLQQEQDATGAAAQIFVLLSTENPWAVLCEIWVCIVYMEDFLICHIKVLQTLIDMNICRL